MEMLFGLSGNIDNAVAFDGKRYLSADNASCYCRLYSAQKYFQRITYPNTSVA
jgi:hypothetical protein